MNRSLFFPGGWSVVSRRILLMALPALFILTPASGQAAKGEWFRQGRGAVWKPAQETSASEKTNRRNSKPKSKPKAKFKSSKKSGANGETSAGISGRGNSSAGTGSTGNLVISGGAIPLNFFPLIPGLPIISAGGGGTVTVTGGGLLGAGNSPAIITFNGPLILTASSTLSFDLLGTNQTIGGGINDLMNGVTALTLDGTLNIHETNPGSFLGTSLGDKWRLINYSGGLTDNGLALGSVPALPAGFGFAVDTATAGQVNVMVVPASAGNGMGAIPEPSTAVLLALASAACARRSRQREKHY